MVMPSRARSRITTSTSPTSSGSSALVGSSNSRRSGRMASARAMPTRCFWPPDSRAGKASRLSEQPDLREQGQRLVADLGLRPPLHLDRCFHEVLQHGEMRPQREVLEDHADARPDAGQPAIVHDNSAGGDAHRFAVQVDLADIGPFQPVDAAQQGRLARARGPQHADRLALADLETDVGQHLVVAKALGDADHAQHRIRGRHGRS